MPSAMPNTAVLFIDLQRDYFTGGAMELAGADTAVAAASLLLSAARAAGLLVIHIQHLATRPGATFFLPGTAGAELHPSVAPQAGEPVLVKHYPNSFRDTGLAELLTEHGIRQLIIGGMMTHLCVDTTVRAAFDLGFACVLAPDACATRALEWEGVHVPAAQVQAAYLAALGAIFAKIQPVSEILAAWS